MIMTSHNRHCCVAMKTIVLLRIYWENMPAILVRNLKTIRSVRWNKDNFNDLQFCVCPNSKVTIWDSRRQSAGNLMLARRPSGPDSMYRWCLSSLEPNVEIRQSHNDLFSTFWFRTLVKHHNFNQIHCYSCFAEDTCIAFDQITKV